MNKSHRHTNTIEKDSSTHQQTQNTKTHWILPYLEKVVKCPQSRIFLIKQCPHFSQDCDIFCSNVFFFSFYKKIQICNIFGHILQKKMSAYILEKGLQLFLGMDTHRLPHRSLANLLTSPFVILTAYLFYSLFTACLPTCPTVSLPA